MRGKFAIGSVFAVTLLVVLSGMIIHLTSLDGLDDFVLSLMADEDTEYSIGYDEQKFKKIRPGFRKSQVLNLIGEPLLKAKIDNTDEEVWRYSRSPSSSHYRERVLLFKEDTVEKVHTEFYID